MLAFRKRGLFYDKLLIRLNKISDYQQHSSLNVKENSNEIAKELNHFFVEIGTNVCASIPEPNKPYSNYMKGNFPLHFFM